MGAVGLGRRLVHQAVNAAMSVAYARWVEAGTVSVSACRVAVLSVKSAAVWAGVYAAATGVAGEVLPGTGPGSRAAIGHLFPIMPFAREEDYQEQTRRFRDDRPRSHRGV